MDFIPSLRLGPHDLAYPKNLSNVGIKSSLNILGDAAILQSELFVAVIGSRKATIYGQAVVKKLVEGLVNVGATIVSGFMYGIDMYAHNRAIECGGKTLCILGYGLGHLEHATPKYVIETICSAGAFVSQYEHDISPKKWTFAKRNELIAGFSALLIVIEAEQKSGSFITCNYAQKFNRPIYAVPGSIFSETSVGTNMLLKEGKAKLLLSFDEVLYDLMGESVPSKKEPKLDDKVRQTVIENVVAGVCTFDNLLTLLNTCFGYDYSATITLLASMELDGALVKKGIAYYVS